jgi:DNA modification methylase
VPSLEAAYVWHASKFTREVLDGLLKIGFIHHQQIIWDKGRTVLTRTLYWFQHEPCWFVRKKTRPGSARPARTRQSGTRRRQSLLWAAATKKWDHPTQKPVELMRRPILNHHRRGELVYDPFLGSGTTLAAAELNERVCFGIELDPKYVDVVIQRWQLLTGKSATLGSEGRTFDEIAKERREQPPC